MLTKYIAKLREFCARDLRQHLLDHKLDVFIRCHIARRCVRAKKRWDNFEWRLVIQSPDYAQNLQFIIESQPVTRFRFNCCRAALENPIDALFSGFEKFVLGRGARLLYRGPNPAASFGDLLITFAARTPFKIVEPISCKNQMRMRIDKSRQHNATAGINDLRAARFLFDFITQADTVDFAITNEHSAIANNCQLAHFSANARPFRTSEGDQLRNVKNSQCLHDSLSLPSTTCLMFLNCASESALIFRSFS